MIALFVNPDEYLVQQRIAQLKQALGDPEMADLNVTELAGDRTDAEDLLYHANTMPFLAERRLVIVRGYLTQLDKRMAASKSTNSAAHKEAARLLQGLDQLPESCDLVFLEQGVDKRRHLWKGFALEGSGKQKIPGLEARIKSGTIQLETLATPDVRSLPGWIQRQARNKGVTLEGRAVQMLADFVGPNLRQLDNELDKLAAYAAGRRITPEDVRLLVSDASEALIWDLTDALSQRNGRKAMRSLQELRRNDANPFYLLTMIARQFRILIKVKEATAGRRGNEYDIARQVGEKPYPVKKAMQQSGRFAQPELDAILDRLLEADYAMKTGADPDTTIDVLVAELTARRPQRS